MSILSDYQIAQRCGYDVVRAPKRGGGTITFLLDDDGNHFEMQTGQRCTMEKVRELCADFTGEFNHGVYKHNTPEDMPMIEPFSIKQNRERTHIGTPAILARKHMTDEQRAKAEASDRIVSWGLSSFGYDIRCSNQFKIFTNINSSIVDPKNFDEGSFVEFEGDVCIIPPNSFALARSVEYFRIPRDILTICLGKSTYARCGIIVNVTPFEPEWEGYVTLEFSNTTPLPAKIYANEGCAQVTFLAGTNDCAVSYKDRGGKYMHQAATPVIPKM